MSARLAPFLAAAGWAGARCAPLAEDASFRRYLRVERGGRRAVCMDADPDREDVAAFVSTARLLLSLGLSAPRVLAADPGAGLALLEDLGDGTFSRLLDGGADPRRLYALATDLLVELHRRFDAAAAGPLPGYDERTLVEEAGLLARWYIPAATGRPVADAELAAYRGIWADALAAARVVEAGLLARWYIPAATGRPVADAELAAYRGIWADALAAARDVPETLVLRDFHAGNLIELGGRAGVARCGLLDFQDAAVGPASYDLVSLLEDARRDVAPDVAAMARARYLAAFPGLDGAAFDRSCRVLGAQRHCKVLGVFTRLRDRDGKPGYLAHAPRLWRLLEGALAEPALAALGAWLDRNVPGRLRTAPPARGAA